ncbi:MAG: HAD-IA family hydrolase [Alphaproteobacteria bacterium]|nr:HAD-IA family hydrolase [Alphaproteobacteria bacterium]
MSLRGCLVVFDLDGTLVDSHAHIARAVRLTADLAGLPEPSAESISAGIGLSLGEVLARLFPMATPDKIVEVASIYRRVFADWRAKGEQHEPLFADSQDVITELEAAGCLLGIATGKGRRGVDYLLGKHNLVGRFVTIQTPDTAPGKPDPGMLLQAMAEAGVDAARTIMVGDTTYDILMARAAGTHAVGVGWGNHPADSLHESGAHAVIERWPEFMQLSARLLQTTGRT